MKKKSNKKFIYLVCGFILFSILLSFFLSTFRKIIKESKLNSTNIDTSTNFLGITPTIFQTEDIEWNQFKHPINHFNFKYPSNWKIILEQHKSIQDWYDVQLTDHNNTNQFRIYFQVGGRDYPPYEEKHEDKILGSRNIKWTTLYQNGKAIEAFTSFPNNDFGDNLTGLYIYLPEENQQEFIQQVEEMIASLK